MKHYETEEKINNLWHRLYNLPENVIALEIARDRIEEGKTFSKEAVELLQEEILIFLMARLCRHWEDTGVAPTHLTALVSVGFEDDRTGKER